MRRTNTLRLAVIAALAAIWVAAVAARGDSVKAGATDQTFNVVIYTAADGTPTTGGTITDIDLTYVRCAATAVKADATALAAADSAHADNKAFEIDGTNAPGLYRVDWPDAAFAAGMPYVDLYVKLASSFPAPLRVMINQPVDAVAIEGADPTDTIRDSVVNDATLIDASALNTLSGHDPGANLGTSTLTQTQVTGGAYALDTDANGRIRIVDGTGAGELDTSSGLVQLLVATQASIDAIETDTGTTLNALILDIPTVAEFELRTLLAADYFVVGDYTAQTGDAYAYLGTNLGALGANATEAGGTGDQFTGIASVGAVAGAVGSVTGAVGSVTGAVGSVTGNVGGNVTGSVGSLVGHTPQTADHTANIAAILVDTAEIGAAGAGLTAVPWNAAWTASTAGAVWNALTATYGTAGTYGALVETTLDVTVSSRPTAAQVQAAVTAAMVAYDVATPADVVLINR